MTTTTPLHEWIISSIYYSGEGGCVCIVTVGYLEPTSSYDESCTVHLNNDTTTLGHCAYPRRIGHRAPIATYLPVPRSPHSFPDVRLSCKVAPGL